MNNLIKNLIIGAGSILSLFPSVEVQMPRMYRHSNSTIESLRRDWERIGQDFIKSLNEVEKPKLNG